jgi:hypothetical protein
MRRYCWTGLACIAVSVTVVSPIYAQVPPAAAPATPAAEKPANLPTAKPPTTAAVKPRVGKPAAAKPTTTKTAPPPPISPRTEERLLRIETALSNAGLLVAEKKELSPEQVAKKQELENRLRGIARQITVLEDAVKNGLAPEAAKPSLDKLEAEQTTTKRELDAIESPIAPTAEPLSQRLDRIDRELNAVKPLPQTTTTAPAAVTTPQPQAATSTRPVEEKPKSPLAGYQEKFFLRSADDKFTLGFVGQLQTRAAFTSFAEELGKRNELAFSIPRSRFGISGNAYGKGITYTLLVDFSKGNTTLLDSWLDFELLPKQLYVRVGQMKKPFSRQQITSSSALQFADPASTDKNFGTGYDIGIMLHDRFDKSPMFEWGLGIYNGSGYKSNFSGGTVTGTATTDDTGKTTVTGSVAETATFNNVPKRLRPTLVGRLGFNTPNLKGYSESDLEGGAPRFGIAASAQREFDFDDNDTSNLRAEVDSIVKAYGFSATGGLYFGWLENASTYHDKDLHYEGLGWHLQTGYVVAKLVEPAIRWDGFSKDGPWNNVQALLVGVNLFLSGHKLKVSADAGPEFVQWQSSTDPSEHKWLTNATARLQAQLAF